MKNSRLFTMVVAMTALASVVVIAQNQDLSNVQIKTTKISNNFYTLEGQGGTIGVLAGTDGVLMVDSQFAPLTEKIVAAIKQITPSSIRVLINTHLHGDHTGGNENLAKLGVTIYSRDQLRHRMANPNPGPNGAPGTPAPAAALPVFTYDQKITFHLNGEDVEAFPSALHILTATRSCVS
jgi:cyclase